MFLDTWLNAFLALMAILNPIGIMPVFHDIASDLEPAVRKRLFDLVTLTGFLTLSLLTLTGKWVMQYVFQIEMPEFRIAGGILLTIISVNRIISNRTPAQEDAGSNVMEMGVVPMAVPLLVGPGSIVTAIIILDRDGMLIAFSAIIAVFLLTWIILRFSGFLNRLLGRFGRLVLSRILWIFIAAIGVHFLTTGIKEIFFPV